MKIISFTGGYGAQIISTAAYLHLKNIDPEKVGAYFGYFTHAPHLATPGVKNDMSHWKWEMNNFSIEMNDFIQPTVTDSYPSDRAEIIWDGPEKLELGMLGLKNSTIASKFSIDIESIKYKQEMFGVEMWGMLHMRRGDYLNVASYLVSDESFLRVTKTITNLVKNLLIISDSEIPKPMIMELKKLKINCITAIGGSPHLVHGLMRLSDILICSNSQFSMTAAALRGENSLTLYPAQHDGDLQSYSNKFLANIRDFQVITR